MIEVSVILEARSVTLKEVDVRGHGSKSDSDYSIVCAAVSSLARTAARTLERTEGFAVTGEAETRGDLRFSVEEERGGDEGEKSERRYWLRGVTDYFLTGVRDIESEYPAECRVKIRTEGEIYGT